MTEKLNEAEIQALILKFLNETRPDELMVKRVQLVLNLGVEPLLAYIYEEGRRSR